MLGYNAIPQEWKGGIPAIADKKFSYTDFTFKTICDSTEKRTLALVKKTGGRIDGDRIFVKTQAPKAAKLELWDDYGSPRERIANGDPRWQWKGNWRQNKQTKFASDKGAEASIDFQGTGFIVTGPYTPSGGKADVYLDGKLVKTVDVYPDEDSFKSGDSVYHAFKLKDTKHTVRIVVRGEPYPGSKGADIGIDDIVVFR
jgi:hypothetical protein